MTDPVLVEPLNLATVQPADVSGLIGDLRAEGLDARLAYEEAYGAGPEVVEAVALWVAERAGEAAVSQAIASGVEWMRQRFRQTPHKKALYVMLYEGNQGRILTIIEMNSPGEEPVGRTPDEFERYTRTKPPERRSRPWWRRWLG